MFGIYVILMCALFCFSWNFQLHQCTSVNLRMKKLHFLIFFENVSAARDFYFLKLKLLEKLTLSLANSFSSVRIRFSHLFFSQTSSLTSIFNSVFWRFIRGVFNSAHRTSKYTLVFPLLIFCRIAFKLLNLA